MPNITVNSPTVGVPADRLTLSVTEARDVMPSIVGHPGSGWCGCFADEVAASLPSIMCVSCYCHADGSKV